MARLLVFVDPEAVCDVADRAQEWPRADTDHVGGSQPHAATWLLEALKPYAPHLDLVVSRPGRAAQGLSDAGAGLPTALQQRVVDAFGGCPAPRELSRPEQTHYWLARTYVLRTPSWVAIERDRDGWPESTWPYIVECGAADSAAVSERLRRVLERFDWSELWWAMGRRHRSRDGRWRDR